MKEPELDQFMSPDTQTPERTILEALNSVPSEVAAKAIIEWMKSDSCSSDDFHEIRSFMK